MSDQHACCAHLRVNYRTEDLGDGTVRGYWACTSCLRRFVQEAEVERLAKLLHDGLDRIYRLRERAENAEAEVERLTGLVERRKRLVTAYAEATAERDHLRADVERLRSLNLSIAYARDNLQDEVSILRAECRRLGNANQSSVAEINRLVDITEAARHVVATVTTGPEGEEGLFWTRRAEEAVERLIKVVKRQRD